MKIRAKTIFLEAMQFDGHNFYTKTEGQTVEGWFALEAGAGRIWRVDSDKPYIDGCDPVGHVLEISRDATN